jgi:hypothetical protein
MKWKLYIRVMNSGFFMYKNKISNGMKVIISLIYMHILLIWLGRDMKYGYQCVYWFRFDFRTKTVMIENINGNQTMFVYVWNIVISLCCVLLLNASRGWANVLCHTLLQVNLTQDGSSENAVIVCANCTLHWSNIRVNSRYIQGFWKNVHMHKRHINAFSDIRFHVILFDTTNIGNNSCFTFVFQFFLENIILNNF